MIGFQKVLGPAGSMYRFERTAVSRSSSLGAAKREAALRGLAGCGELDTPPHGTADHYHRGERKIAAKKYAGAWRRGGAGPMIRRRICTLAPTLRTPARAGVVGPSG